VTQQMRNLDTPIEICIEKREEANDLTMIELAMVAGGAGTLNFD
jgi:hypothetical protein